MRYRLIYCIICILTCKSILANDSLDFKKYKVEKGSICYKVFELIDKEEKELYDIIISFNHFGSEETITIVHKDSVITYNKLRDLQQNAFGSNNDWKPRIANVYPELFVSSKSSKMNQGIELFKYQSIKYEKLQCEKYSHFQFSKYVYMGSVIYFNDIPLYIKISDSKKTNIIKAIYWSFL